MLITFERTGGFAGIRLTKVIDTTNLSSEEANQVQELIAESDFFNLPANITSPNQIDRFQYKVTLEENAHQHTVVVDEKNTPAKLKPLLDWLTAAGGK